MEEKATSFIQTETCASFLFIRSYPAVSPGSQIVVPERPEVRNEYREVVSIGSVI
jgi:hypothetical protein